MISMLRNVCKLKIPTRCVRTPHSLRPLRRVDKSAVGFPKYSINSRSFKSLTTTSNQKNSFSLPTGTVNSNFRRHCPQKIKFGHPRSANTAEKNKRDDISYEQYLYLKKEKQEKMFNSKVNKLCSSSQYKNKFLERSSSKQKRRHFTSEAKRVQYPKFPIQPKFPLYMAKRTYSTNKNCKGCAGDEDCFQYFQDKPIKKPSLLVPREQFATPVTPDFRYHRTGLPKNVQYGFNIKQDNNITVDHKETEGLPKNVQYGFNIKQDNNNTADHKETEEIESQNESNIAEVAAVKASSTEPIPKSQLPTVEVWTTQRPDSIFEGKTPGKRSGIINNLEVEISKKMEILSLKKSEKGNQLSTTSKPKKGPIIIQVVKKQTALKETLNTKSANTLNMVSTSYQSTPNKKSLKGQRKSKKSKKRPSHNKKSTTVVQEKSNNNSNNNSNKTATRTSVLENCRGIFNTLYRKIKGPQRRNAGSFNLEPPNMIFKDLSYSTNTSNKEKSTSCKVKYPWNLATDQIENTKSSRIVYCNPNNISATEPDLPKMEHIEQRSPLVVCRIIENRSFEKENNNCQNSTSKKKEETPTLSFSACTNNVMIDKGIPNAPNREISNFNLAGETCTNTSKSSEVKDTTLKIKIPDPPLSTCTKNVTQANQDSHEKNILNLLDDCQNFCKSTCTKNSTGQTQQDFSKKDIQNILDTCNSISKPTEIKKATTKIEIPDPPSSTCTKSVVGQIKQDVLLDKCKNVFQTTETNELTSKIEIPDPPISTCAKSVIGQMKQQSNNKDILNILDTCKTIPKSTEIKEHNIKIQIPDPPSSTCTKNAVAQIKNDILTDVCKSVPKPAETKELTSKIEIPDPPKSTCTNSVIGQTKQQSNNKDILNILDTCKTIPKSTEIKEHNIKIQIPDPPPSTCTKNVVAQIKNDILTDVCKSVPKPAETKELTSKIEIPDPPKSTCTNSVIGQTKQQSNNKDILNILDTCKTIPKSTATKATIKIEIPDPPSSTCTKSVVSQMKDACKSDFKVTGTKELTVKIEIPDPPSSTCSKSVIGQTKQQSNNKDILNILDTCKTIPKSTETKPAIKIEIPDPPSSTCTKSVISQMKDACKSDFKVTGTKELTVKIEIPDPPSSTCSKNVIGQITQETNKKDILNILDTCKTISKSTGTKKSTYKIDIPDPPPSTCTKSVVSQINDTCKSIRKTSEIEGLTSQIQIPDPPSSTCTNNVVGQIKQDSDQKNIVSILGTCKTIPEGTKTKEPTIKIEIPDPPSSTCSKSVVGQVKQDSNKNDVLNVMDTCKTVTESTVRKESPIKIEIPDPPSSTCAKTVGDQVKQYSDKKDILGITGTCKTVPTATVTKESAMKIEIPDPPSSTCTKSVGKLKQNSDKKDIQNVIDACKTVPTITAKKEASNKIEIPDPPPSTCTKSAMNRAKITCTNQSDIGIENAEGPYRSKHQLCNDSRTDEYSNGPYRSIQQVCKNSRSSSKEPTLASSSNSNSSKNCSTTKDKPKTNQEPKCNNKETKKEQNRSMCTGTKKEEVKKSSSCNELKKSLNCSSSKTKVSNYEKPKEVLCNPCPTIKTKESKETKKISCREKCIEERKKKKEEVPKESKCKNQKENKKQEVAKNCNKSNKCEDKNKKVDIQAVKVQDTCGMVSKNPSKKSKSTTNICNKKNTKKSDSTETLNPNKKAKNLVDNSTNPYCSENRQPFPQTRILKHNDLCAFKKPHILTETEDFDPNKKATNLLLKSTSTPSECDKRYNESKFDTKPTDSNAKKTSPKYRSCVNIKANRKETKPTTCENKSSKKQDCKAQVNTCTDSKKKNACQTKDVKRTESENSIKTCTNKDLSKEDIRKRGICSDIKRPDMCQPVKLEMKENIGADCSSKKKKVESKKECSQPKQVEKCDQLVKEFLNKSKGEGDKKMDVKTDYLEPKKESIKPKESKKENCDQLIKDALCKSKGEKKADKKIDSKTDCSKPKTDDPKLKKAVNCDELVKEFLLKTKSDYVPKSKKAGKKTDSKKDCSKSKTKCATPKQSEKCDRLVKEFLLKLKGGKKGEEKMDSKKDCSRPKTESQKADKCEQLVKEFLSKSKHLGDFTSKRKTSQKKKDSKKDCSQSKEKCATPKQSEKCDQLVKEFLLKSKGGFKSGNNPGAPAAPVCSGKSNIPGSSSVKRRPDKTASPPSTNLNRYQLLKSPNAESTKITTQNNKNNSIDLSNPSTILDLTNEVHKTREMLPLDQISQPKKSNARPSTAYHVANTSKSTGRESTSASELTKHTDKEADNVYNKYQKLTLDIFQPFKAVDQINSSKDSKIVKTESTFPCTSKFNPPSKEILKNQTDKMTNEVKTPLPLKPQRSKSTPSITINASSHTTNKQQINDHPIFEYERCKENETSSLPLFKETENSKKTKPKTFSISSLKPRVFDLIDDKDLFVCKIQKLSEPSGKVLRTLQCKLIKDEYGRDVFVCNDVTDVSDENGNVKKS
ncbi:unnamed protein product [Diabrotica balteata]|uniref:Uncharacterized protein n=1 Tax=Diabrotica balteata TaxID=107213 RepID=A0A9N9SXH4_DIABA|nr:unnamed protein product [Diabrotica balteata]